MKSASTMKCVAWGPVMLAATVDRIAQVSWNEYRVDFYVGNDVTPCERYTSHIVVDATTLLDHEKLRVALLQQKQVVLRSYADWDNYLAQWVGGW